MTLLIYCGMSKAIGQCLFFTRRRRTRMRLSRVLQASAKTGGWRCDIYFKYKTDPVVSKKSTSITN